MPAINRKNTHFPRAQLDLSLQGILDSHASSWSAWFYPSRITPVLTKLADQVKNVNFFESDYGITTFYEFLEAFVKSKPQDSEVLRKFNAVFQQLQNRVISQSYANFNQTEIATQHLKLINIMMRADHRYLFNQPEITIYANTIKNIAEAVTRYPVNENFIESYCSVVKYSFDLMPFLSAYQEAYEGTIRSAENVFLQKDNFTVPMLANLYSTLAYQIKLLDFYKDNYEIKVPVKTAQDEIMQRAILLQDFFFAEIRQSKRKDIDISFLKKFFYYRLLKKTGDSSLESRCKTDLAYYCDPTSPLPDTFFCDPHLFPSNQVVKIESLGVAADQIAIACKAMSCAARRHEEWRRKINVTERQFNTTITHSNYIYRIFPDDKSWEKETYIIATPYSTGFYDSQGVMGSEAKGIGYAKWRPELHDWISVSAHEFAHHSNFVAFRDLHRNFNEGSAYVFIHGICGDRSYHNWLKANVQNITSLAPLLQTDFIGYSLSFTYMAYLIDTQPVIFSEYLKLYQEGKHQAFKEKLAELVRTDTYFPDWLQSYLKVCSAVPLEDLQEGDCPSISLNDYRMTTFNTNKPSSPTISQKGDSRITEITAIRPVFYDDHLRLLHAINGNNIIEMLAILKNSSYLAYILNYRDPTRNFETPLLFTLNKQRGNCLADVVDILISHGANPAVCDKFGVTAYQFAERHCENWLEEIKPIFDRTANIANTTVSTTPLPGDNKGFTWDLSSHGWALAAGLCNGASAAIIDIAINAGKKQEYFGDRVAESMRYGFKPLIVTLGTLAYTLSAMGPATGAGIEDSLLSALFYSTLNYTGAVLSQLVLSKLVSPSKAFFLFFLFSNAGFIFSKESSLHTLQTVVNGLLSTIVSMLGYGGMKYANRISFQFGEEKANSNDVEMASSRKRIIGTPTIEVPSVSYLGISEAMEILDKRLQPLRSYKGYQDRIGEPFTQLSIDFSRKAYKELGRGEIYHRLSYLASIEGAIKKLQGISQYKLESVLNIVHCIQQACRILLVTHSSCNTRNFINENIIACLQRTVVDIPIDFEILWTTLSPVLEKNKEIAEHLNVCEKILYDKILYLYTEHFFEQYDFNQLMQALYENQVSLNTAESQESLKKSLLESLGGYLNSAKSALKKLNNIVCKKLNDQDLRSSAVDIMNKLQENIESCRIALINAMQFEQGVKSQARQAEAGTAQPVHELEPLMSSEPSRLSKSPPPPPPKPTGVGFRTHHRAQIRTTNTHTSFHKLMPTGSSSSSQPGSVSTSQLRN